MKKNKFLDKQILLDAIVSVSNTESDMDFVQVMPTNPRKGLVKPFSGQGHGQMLSDGTFDFVRRRRIRRLPVLKLPHSSVSYGEDGFDRYTFTLPSEYRGLLPKLLRAEAKVAAEYVEHEVWGGAV